MSACFFKKLFFIVLVTLSPALPNNVFGQFQYNYLPMDSFHYAQKNLLIDIFKNNLSVAKAKAGGKYQSKIHELYDERTKKLIEFANENYFINDDGLQSLVQNILDDILKNDPVTRRSINLLITRDPAPNAYCWGEGTITINLGLLQRLNSESELAFIIAHELSHHLANHVHENAHNIIIKRNNKAEIKDKIKELGNLDAFKNIIYDEFEYTRQYEMKADSMALCLLQDTRYDITAYKKVFAILDSAKYPVLKADTHIEKVFNFSKYPFKEKWLIAPESSFGVPDSTSFFIFNKDSLRTHPDLVLRTAYLDSMVAINNYAVKKNDDPFSKEFKARIDFEMAESSYQLKNYAYSLFYLLQLKEIYPSNRYVNTRTAHLLVELYKCRKNHTFGKYVPLLRTYPAQMESVFIFLNNLRMTEIGKIAFNFLNNEKHFDKTNEDHHYLLWEISDLLDIGDVREAVKEEYIQNFPDGKYSLFFNN